MDEPAAKPQPTVADRLAEGLAKKKGEAEKKTETKPEPPAWDGKTERRQSDGKTERRQSDRRKPPATKPEAEKVTVKKPPEEPAEKPRTGFARLLLGR